MVFRKRLRRTAFLLLSASILIAVLSGCGSGGDTPATGPGPSSDAQPTLGPAPNEVLADAFEASMGDLRARFEASPLSRFSGLTGGGSRTVEFETSVPEDNLSFSGVLVADNASGMADLTLAFPEAGLTALCHYDSEFMGVSCKEIFGDGRWYGLRPYGLTEQLEGSALASMLELNMEAVTRLDEALSSIPREERPDSAPLLDAFAALTRDLIENTKPEVKEENFTVVLTAHELAGYLRKLVERCPVLREIYTFLGGTEGLDEVIDSIENGGVDTALTFRVSGDRVRHVSAEYKRPDGTVYLEAELYGDAGNLLRVTVEPCFNLELTLDTDVHMMLNTYTGDGSTTTLDWAADGAFNFITYSTDITALALDGTLTVNDGSMSYEGIWFSGNRGDRNPLTLTSVPGGEVKIPEETASLTELTEREILRIITHTVS